MPGLTSAWQALSYGGPLVYPLLALGVLAFIIILDRVVAYRRWLRPTASPGAISTVNSRRCLRITPTAASSA